MRVLLTTDTVGGVWTYAVELARAARPLGVDFVFATMGDPLSPDQRAQVEALPNVEVREGTFKLEWMQDPWDDVRRTGDWLLDLERQTRPDVVHLNGYAHGRCPFVAPKLVVGHSCVASWWEAVKGELAPAEWDRYRSEVRAGLRAADLVVAPSRAMLGTLARHYGPLPASRVIYNGRDPSRYRPAAAKEPFVLAAGRLWDEAKNVAALAAIAPDLPWPVRVAGESRHPDGGGGGAVATPNLHSLGRLDEAAMADAFARAAVYCLPARYEPFGLSALEAALSGCALVLGDVRSLREVWGDAAAYVAPDDRAGLRNALLGLIESPGARAAAAGRARARALWYTAAAKAGAYLRVYQELTTAGAVAGDGLGWHGQVPLPVSSRPEADTGTGTCPRHPVTH